MMASPVAGFRPIRAARLRTCSIPRPGIWNARAFLQMLANIVIDLMDALKRSIKGSGRQKAAALNANTSSKKTKRPRRKRRAA